MEETQQPKEEVKGKENFSQAQMTHLVSYEAQRDQEIRLHDAEFRGRHYFDFRFYEKRTRGMVPTPRGIRLGLQAVEHLEDAISRWKSFIKRFEVSVPQRGVNSDSEKESETHV